MRLKQYKVSLEEVHPSLDASLSSKKPKRDSGTDLIVQELDEFNNDYTDTVNLLVDRINELGRMSSVHHGLQVSRLLHVLGDNFFFSFYLLRTGLDCIQFWGNSLIFKILHFGLGFSDSVLSSLSTYYSSQWSMQYP